MSTGFVAVAGVIWMFASTNVLTASPVLPPVPFVSVVTVAPPIVRLAEACPVTFPAVPEVKVIVHCPLASVFAPASSQVLDATSMTSVDPLESVSVASTCSP